MVSRRSHLRKAEARGAREHWGLEPYQQAAAAALTGDTIDLLKTAASLGSIEIGGNAPLLTKVIDAGFLEKTLGCPMVTQGALPRWGPQVSSLRRGLWHRP
jgi:hypothetical protein